MEISGSEIGAIWEQRVVGHGKAVSDYDPGDLRKMDCRKRQIQKVETAHIFSSETGRNYPPMETFSGVDTTIPIG